MARDWHVVIGRIRLSVSTVNRTYELSGITHVTLFPKYGKHSTGPSTYGPWVRTYSKSFSCKPVLTVCSYRAQSNEIFTYGEVSRGSVPRVRRYGLLYLRAVEYDHWLNTGPVCGLCPIMFVLTQSYQCDTCFFCSTLRELAVSNLGQLLFCRSITWSRCCNAYRDLWIMTILH